MVSCIDAGFHAEGMLPGGLEVRRRAPGLYRRLALRAGGDARADSMDWLNVVAMAVNEENAGGGRVVTAPTNGAAGIIPAVMFWALQFLPGLDDAERQDDAVVRYLLTSAAVAVFYKERASISGAEVGCQGEVGLACSRAAAGLAELLRGSPRQVENTAEIGIKHNLGLTCDPIGGLVQIPCIERNAIAAVKAVNAAKMALYGVGIHRGFAGSGDRDHAADRYGHALDVAGRVGGECSGVLRGRSHARRRWETHLGATKAKVAVSPALRATHRRKPSNSRSACRWCVIANVETDNAITGAKDLDKKLDAWRKTPRTSVPIASLPDGAFIALGDNDSASFGSVPFIGGLRRGTPIPLRSRTSTLPRRWW
jgi:L-serine deaminase